MQTLEDRLVFKVKTSSKSLMEKYFEEWLKAETVEEREQIHAKSKALTDLQFNIINSIRGDKDG